MTLLPLINSYNTVNGLFRGTLCVSDEAQHVCTIECSAILVVFDLSLTYHLSTAVYTLSYRFTIINSTLYGITDDPPKRIFFFKFNKYL